MKLQKCTIAISPFIAILKPEIRIKLMTLDHYCNPVKDKTGRELGPKCELYFKAQFSKRELREMRARKYPEGLYISYTNTYDSPCFVQEGHDSSYAVNLYTYEEVNSIVISVVEEVKSLKLTSMNNFVVISHKEAIENVIIPSDCSEVFDNPFFKMFLESISKKTYRVEVIESLRITEADKYKMLKPVDSVEELVHTIKAIKLYKNILRPIIRINEKAEIKKFKLSCCFVIDDVSKSETCTFFKVAKDPEGIKDVVFNDASLKEALGCKVSKNGYYYLVGDWHFFRCKVNPVLWEARRFKEEVIDYVHERQEI